MCAFLITRYSEITIKNREVFLRHVFLAPPLMTTLSEFRYGLRYETAEWKNLTAL